MFGLFFGSLTLPSGGTPQTVKLAVANEVNVLCRQKSNRYQQHNTLPRMRTRSLLTRNLNPTAREHTTVATLLLPAMAKLPGFGSISTQ